MRKRVVIVLAVVVVAFIGNVERVKPEIGVRAERTEPAAARGTTAANLRFDPVTKHLIGAVVTNRLGNGEIREITYEQIGHQVAYLRCGMYSGPGDRGTPEENYHHGMPVGEKVGGETYDLCDPNVRMHIAGFEDHLCRATCDGKTTVGILECRNPAIYEMCRAGVPGLSILE